ncbi:MAG: flagellar basal body rod protein FlgB [Wenzhouxiangella sp.]|jgi:flagellar basal-body rod protein FlgB|nr:flagellar basal body rod protein FlgB [Wenzhouxiangella sp.]
MSLNIDKHFGVHAQAVQLRSQRTELLAANIANADTPGYKARDLDFQSVLRRTAETGEGLRVTHERHMLPNGAAPGQAPVLYRVPIQPSLDGNTVDVQQEQAAFAENAVRYQASLEFLSGRVRGLITAIKGQSQ